MADAITVSAVVDFDGLPGDRKPQRGDRSWQPIHCAECDWATERVDSWQVSGSLFKRDTRCVNRDCSRYSQTWTYWDFRGLTDEQKRDSELRGILVD